MIASLFVGDEGGFAVEDGIVHVFNFSVVERFFGDADGVFFIFGIIPFDAAHFF